MSTYSISIERRGSDFAMPYKALIWRTDPNGVESLVGVGAAKTSARACKAARREAQFRRARGGSALNGAE